MAKTMGFEAKEVHRDNFHVAPHSGIFSVIPTKLVPYCELIRINKPVGFIYLYTSCASGTLLVECLSDQASSTFRLISTNIVLLVSAILFRSAACSWNDTIDQEIDQKVSRTRLRPLARGAISTNDAHKCTVLFLIGFLALQSTLSMMQGQMGAPVCAYYSTVFVVATGIYPFLKRITHYPQILLGFMQSWGIAIAFPAMGADLFTSKKHLTAASCKIISVMAWTMLNDTIYGFQDLEDDLKSGVKSLAVRTQDHPKILFGFLAATQVIALALTGFTIEAGIPYYVGLLAVLALLGVVICKVDLGDPENCGWWFQVGCHSVGIATVCCFLVEYVSRVQE